MTEHEIEVFVSKMIWAIAGISSECGNAVMDILDLENYEKVSKMQKENINFKEGES
jgi:hypothetical protein